MIEGSKDGQKVVPDTSSVIDAIISEGVKRGDFKGSSIVIPEAVVAELEAQANRGLEIGFEGLEELQRLQDLANENRIKLFFHGKRPNLDQVKLARGGEIDSLIRETAIELGAKFITGDRIQSMVAKAMGIDVEFVKPEPKDPEPLSIEKFFTPDTMSVHLKNRVPPMAKKGSIGDVRYVKIGDVPSTYGELKDMSRELLDRARSDHNSFFELSFSGASVLQIGNMRIAIANPPFSDDFEITAVRPVASVSLEQYRLSDKLKERIRDQRGILISGPPGAGKSTFAAGVATYLNNKGFVVKTMESPRDLQVPNEITQYAPLDDSLENTADVLLLVRPDYTIYDEVRKTKDFEIFSDMRLAGVGMIGVVHANRAVDAIQRLIGRVELGVIPQVVDTVIFIDKGEVAKVQILQFTVKVPAGMMEQDLARPVILISDFETGKSEFEIYTYGEQVVVMPLGEEQERKPSWKLAEGEVQEVLEDYASGPVSVEMVSDSRALVKVREKDLPRIIGKGGSTIDDIERMLGIHIDVRRSDEKEQKKQGEEKEIKPQRPIIERTDRHVILNVPELAAQDVEIYAGDRFLFSATVGRHGDIKVRNDSTVAESVLDAVEEGETVTVHMM
ncbi:Flp pilus assembly complex ATPase component TadA [Methanolobus zinderi]|uniref:Flp pilus assembly complex ATPase component TadA n=1 Tax=Methanolobus zinderi TaxID=536044 RepID=A0A7D5E7Q8_9EURY|nr:PINc/VapC family ATPase [Methanolobus zinderi]QLC51052.1 Flp pilus assembly complex ATPase component TadA [Methanolobus zinderi]